MKHTISSNSAQSQIVLIVLFRNVSICNSKPSLEYDEYGRVVRKENPGGFATRNVYSENGYLSKVKSDDLQTTITNEHYDLPCRFYVAFGFGKKNSQGYRYASITYESDYMFGLPGADGGDRFRSAAVRLDLHPFKNGMEATNVSAGFNVFTGDPGLNIRDRDFGRIQDPFHPVQDNYTEKEQFRLGALYIGFGSLRIGMDTEGIRHTIQNIFAHDILLKGKPAHFLILDKQDQFYWSYGNYSTTSLWGF